MSVCVVCVWVMCVSSLRGVCVCVLCVCGCAVCLCVVFVWCGRCCVR